MGLNGIKFRSHVVGRREKFTPGWHDFSKPEVPVIEEYSCFEETSNSKIRLSSGYEVRSFRELVGLIAELGSSNARFNLFFRGQNEDFRDKNGKTKIYPSIYRAPNKNLSRKVRTKRFEELKKKVEHMRLRSGLSWRSPLSKHPEYWIALIQHYEISSTPLLDVTQSLRVAATFALAEKKRYRRDGFIYVLGLPFLHGSISAFADDQMKIIKLQSVSPPEALRPHYQEGYLVGRWPASIRKEAEDNYAYWMIAKYKLNNENGKFFDRSFQPVPFEALLPAKDDFRNKLKELFNEEIE